MNEKMKTYLDYEVYDGYPREGVVFIDFTPSYYNTKCRNYIINQMSDIIDNLDIDFNNTVIVAPEARGFILGSIIANNYDLPLIIIRKESKFPPQSISVAKEYKTEYSNDCLAIQEHDLHR